LRSLWRKRNELVIPILMIVSIVYFILRW